MSNVIIIGGGAAGMMAAITAARNNNKVTLIEKNEKLGKKLFITGKGRCNFTNAGDEEDIFNSIVTNKKFMYSSLRGFSNYDCMGFFDELGLKFKIERGNRVFPESDHSSDVIGALSRQMKKLGVNVLLNTQVVAVNEENGEFAGVVVKDASGQHVFENSAENRTPAYIIFGVKYDVNILLLKAKYLTEVEVFPVPHGAWVGTEGQIQVSSEELKNYINEKTVMLSDSQLQQTENNTNTDNNTEEQNG